MVLGGLLSFVSDFDISTIHTTSSQNSTDHLSLELQKFESTFNYSFSDTEQFRIEHGKHGNYFSFFNKLGQPYFFIARSKHNKQVTKTIGNETILIKQKAGEIAAVGCSVLRKIKNKHGIAKDVWYICDLKVDEKYQGEHLPLKITQQVGLKRFLQCPRGFGICMNPPNGQPKAAKIFKNHGPFFGLETNILNLYTLTYDQVIKLEQFIKHALVKYGYMHQHQKLLYVSTTGFKDYIIFDTHSSRPWNLLHIKPDDQSSNSASPQENGLHMICAVKNSSLDIAFKQLMGDPSSTAQIISLGMKNFDFNFLTSDQI